MGLNARRKHMPDAPHCGVGRFGTGSQGWSGAPDQPWAIRL